MTSMVAPSSPPRRFILSILLLLGAVQLSSAVFGRRRYRPRYPQTHDNARHPSFKAYRRKVMGEAASTFVPNNENDDDDEGWNREEEGRDFYGKKSASTSNNNQSSRQQYEKALKQAGIRPYKLQPPPKYGKTSLSSKLVMTNVLCYALQVWKPGLTRWGAKRSDMILQGRELYRLVTPVFLHGGIAHLMMNSYSLNNIGPEIERTFGSGRFLATYLASGVAGNMLSSIASPNPAVGASGAIFGLLGAHFVFLNRNERFMGPYGKQGIAAVTETVGTNLVFGYLNPMIDNWGHAGGFLGGAAMAALIGPKLHVLGLPDGRRLVVDMPKYRLPRQLESIGETLQQKFKAKPLPGRTHFQSDFNANPWGKPSSTRSLPKTTNPSRNMLKPRARWDSPVQ